jgi:hypothetical protein
MTKNYQFSIQMVGKGEDEHEAWQDACEYMLENIRGFMETPGDFKIIREK